MTKHRNRRTTEDRRAKGRKTRQGRLVGRDGRRRRGLAFHAAKAAAWGLLPPYDPENPGPHTCEPPAKED